MFRAVFTDVRRGHVTLVVRIKVSRLESPTKYYAVLLLDTTVCADKTLGATVKVDSVGHGWARVVLGGGTHCRI